MTVERVRAGEVLMLQRRLVELDPTKLYNLIGVYSFGKGIFHREPATGAEIGDYRFFTIEPGDLVLSNIQAWEGAIAYATDSDAGTIGTHRFLTYTSIDGRIDTNWTRWFFLSERGMDLIRRAAPGTAVRNRTLAIERFEELEIPLPPINEQREVAARLDRIAALANQIMGLSHQAAVLRQALVEAMIRDRGRSDARHVLDGWKRVALQEVAHLAPDVRSVDLRASYEIAGIYSFGRGLFSRGVIQGADTKYTSLHRLRAGQLVMSRLNGWEGALAVVRSEFDGCYVSSEFPTFDLVSEVDPEYLDLLVRGPMFWQALTSASQGSMVRRKRVNADRLLSQVVELPPLTVQREIARKACAVRQAEASAEGRYRLTAALVPTFLNHAFAGLQ